MPQVNDWNYYVVHGWMINQLKLSGNALVVYAITYGFAQDGETEFSGSLSYISKWLGTSNKGTTIRAIDELIRRGLITKQVIENKNGSKATNRYRIVWPPPIAKTEPEKAPEGSTETTLGGSAEMALPPSAETVPGGSAEMVLGSAKTVPPSSNYINSSYIYNNNIYNNTSSTAEVEENEEKNTEKTAEKESVPFQEITRLYNNLCHTFTKCIKVSDGRKRAIRARWNEYGQDIKVFEKLFRMAEESNFLKGANARNWQANLDWLMKSDNMAKVLEGAYANKGGRSNGSNTNPAGADRADGSSCGQHQGAVDFDAILNTKRSG